MAKPVEPLDLPMRVVNAFVRDLRAFHAEPNATKRGQIAARQLDALQPFQGPRDKKLRTADIHRMIEELKDLS